MLNIIITERQMGFISKKIQSENNLRLGEQIKKQYIKEGFFGSKKYKTAKEAGNELYKDAKKYEKLLKIEPKEEKWGDADWHMVMTLKSNPEWKWIVGLSLDDETKQTKLINFYNTPPNKAAHYSDDDETLKAVCAQGKSFDENDKEYLNFVKWFNSGFRKAFHGKI